MKRELPLASSSRYYYALILEAIGTDHMWLTCQKANVCAVNDLYLEIYCTEERLLIHLDLYMVAYLSEQNVVFVHVFK